MTNVQLVLFMLIDTFLSVVVNMRQGVALADTPDLLPGAAFISKAAGKIGFVGLCTPILAYAGLALGKDIDLLKRQGLRIILVGLMVFVGTFLGSAIIAEAVLRFMK